MCRAWVSGLDSVKTDMIKEAAVIFRVWVWGFVFFWV